MRQDIKHGRFDIHTYRQCGGLFIATGWIGGCFKWNAEGRTREEVIVKAVHKSKDSK